MFGQGMGDYFNTNYYCGPPVYDHWACGGYGYGGQSWHHHHQPFNSWIWNSGYNNYGLDRHANCYVYPNSSTSTESERKNDYKNYERNMGGNSSMGRNDSDTTTADPIWKTIKIDCFSAEMGVSKTQSDIINTSSASSSGRIRTTAMPRRNRKHKLSAETRSVTSLRLMLEKLDKKVSLNESILAFVLLKLNSKKDDEQRCAGGGNANTPYAYYSSDKMQHLENELLEKLKHQVEHSESGTSNLTVDKKFIKDWNKLYHGLGGGLRFDAKPKCTCKLSAEEIRKEFETYFKKKNGTKAKSKTRSKKTNNDKKRTYLKNNNKKPATAKVPTNRAKSPSKGKQAKEEKPVLKTKPLSKENKSSKNNAKPTNTTKPKAQNAPPPNAPPRKKPGLSNISNKTQNKYLPQEVGKPKVATIKNKSFMPSSKKYRIYLDNCVYTADPKRK